MHEAVLRYRVPLQLLYKLVQSGRVRGYAGFDERGKPALYVVEEDVKEVLKHLYPEGKEGGEGGRGGG